MLGCPDPAQAEARTGTGKAFPLSLSACRKPWAGVGCVPGGPEGALSPFMWLWDILSCEMGGTTPSLTPSHTTGFALQGTPSPALSPDPHGGGVTYGEGIGEVWGRWEGSCREEELSRFGGGPKRLPPSPPLPFLHSSNTLLSLHDLETANPFWLRPLCSLVTSYLHPQLLTLEWREKAQP